MPNDCHVALHPGHEAQALLDPRVPGHPAGVDRSLHTFTPPEEKRIQNNS